MTSHQNLLHYPQMLLYHNTMVIHLLVISVTKDFQLWGLVPESLRIMRWVSLFLSQLRLFLEHESCYASCTCALIKSWYFPWPWQASRFHCPFFDAVGHSVKISHLNLITEFICIHKPLVFKYHLVLGKYHVPLTRKPCSVDVQFT